MAVVIWRGNRINIPCDGESTVLKLLMKYTDCDHVPCVRPGTCGRCVILVKRDGEIKEELACRYVPGEMDEIECRFAGGQDRMSVLGGDGGLHNTKFISIDLGSTTIAMTFRGRTYRAVNPQRRYGADVLSRIKAAVEGAGEELADIIREALKAGFSSVDPKGQAEGALVCANTAMIHLLMGYDCSTLGVAPFTPYHTGTGELELGGYRVFTVPCVSGFIGADVVAGLYFLEKNGFSQPFLFADLGTNGEMVLGCGDVCYCASAAAGTAFEGGEDGELFGADLIHMTAEGLRNKVIDNTGLLCDEYFETGYPVYINSNKPHYLTQKMIRELQLAKAAIRCGAGGLLKACPDMPDKLKVFVAGGMGFYLDKDDAQRIGLFPDVCYGDMICAGNTSLLGAQLLCREAERSGRGLKETAERETAEIIRKCRVLSLPDTDGFGDEYIRSLDFGDTCE